MHSRGIAALAFHHVGPHRPGTYPALTVQPRRFERFMRLLRDWGYTGVSSDAWIAWLRGIAPLRERPVLLTFDDAYADLAECALPTLHRLGWGATVFVAASTVGGRNTWDWPAAGGHRIMSAQDICTWASKGIEFGAHGSTHCDLTPLGAERLRAEVLGSRDAIAELLGRPVTSFAYPYGAYNDHVRELVASVFDRAFGLDEGLNNGETDRSRLRRTMVQSTDTVVDLAFRVRLGWSPLQRARALVRVRERARRLSGLIYSPSSRS
jgi:peptidoglycan/xylan/chitin deacetylase (PgdA/CDA1 family)